MNALDLGGVIPPLLTPRGADGRVDRRSLERLCQVQLEAGVAGLFVGGSTGEVALLDDDARDTSLKVVIGTTGGQVPVLAGVIDTGTERVVAHARRAEKLGADAVVSTGPFYVHPHGSEVVAHFEALGASVDLPVVAYDIPSATAERLELAALTELIERRLVVAIKDSSGDLAATRELVERARDTPVRILTGSELLADTAVAFGADGIVPGLGNVDPHGYVRLYDHVTAGDLAGAAAEQRRLSELFAIVGVADRSRIGFTAAALGAFKGAARLRGWIENDRVWPPLGSLTDGERTEIGRRLRLAGLD